MYRKDRSSRGGNVSIAFKDYIISRSVAVSSKLEVVTMILECFIYLPFLINMDFIIIKIMLDIDWLTLKG